MHRKQDVLVDRVNRTVKNYRLIADYSQRPAFVSWFGSVVADYNSSAVVCSQVMKNNEYFSPWVTLLFVSGWIILGGFQVMDGFEQSEDSDAAPLSLGLFLTNLNIFAAVGSAYGTIYMTLLKMQSSFDALEHIVHLMNLPIDIPQRMSLFRTHSELTRQLRQEARAKMPDFNGVALDLLPIRVMDLRFGYAGSVLPGLSSGRMEVRQGTLVSLLGPNSEGKSTLLKILGGVILPDNGACFVPSHLRVLHVGLEIMFVEGNLMKNLTFGADDPSDASDERVRKICKELNLESIMHYLDSGVVKPWSEILSHTQQHYITLARALISNPEVFCVHKPTLPLDEEHSKHIVEILREFVDNRGFILDPATKHLRRPRTCIMTSTSWGAVEASDVIYKVSAARGIAYERREDVNQLDW